MGYGMDLSFVILIPAMIFSFWAQFKVSNTFKRYSQVRNKAGMTGAQAARRVLDANGLGDVEIVPIQGSLTDNYNPMNKTLNLSETVMNVESVSAISVACHEAGHAIQDARDYAPLRIRNNIVPVVNICSRVSWLLIIAGIFLMGYSGSGQGSLILNIGIIAFIAVIVFHLITLPVEFNASSRALQQMEELGLVDSEDYYGAKKVLSAAAMTYIAAAAMAVANLIRVLALTRRN